MSRRLFLAIPLPSAIKNQLFPSIHTDEKVNFTPEEKLHITVHFLGSTEEKDIQDLLEKTGSVTEKFPPFTLTIKHFRLKSSFNKMIWLIFEPSSSFTALSLLLRQALGSAEKRPPLPHVTMARLKKTPQKFLFLPISGEITVNRIELWESKPNPEGSVYSLYHVFHLNGK